MFLKALLLLLTLLVAQTYGAECLNDTLLYTEGDVACPPGWFRWIGNNHCYFIESTTKLNWNNAREKCLTYNAHLMILNSYDENLLLSQLAYGYQLERVWV